MSEFLRNNPFVVCSEELNYVKRELVREGDSLKVKHKTGVILYRATQDRSVVAEGTVLIRTPSDHEGVS